MESSEDDAGNATIASRRASAREKDIGLVEDVETASDTLREPEASASCCTPAMSEDNFDGDSVPSPSAQDINTSTEAILDMIDEFVDGPGAPKRLPRIEVSVEGPTVNESHEPLSETEPKQQIDDIVVTPRTPSPVSFDKSETLNVSTPQKSEECMPHSEVSICASVSSIVRSSQISLVSVDVTETSSNQESETNSAVLSEAPESVAIQSVSDSPSSSIQTVQNISNIECEQLEHLERTVKCVTSSDNRDSVTVERAESTSNECSISESKGFLVEPSSRSPLKRRLVRPVASDRKPDSTVSSTVDSQAGNIHTTQPTSCDVVKDVSSSSDAVPLQHAKVKPEEISNVSEISICKAETSTAPKKIRLVRPKHIPNLGISSKTLEALIPENNQCQSTSLAGDHAISFFPSTSQVDTCILQQHDKISAPEKNVDSFAKPEPEVVPHSKENVISSIRNITASVSPTEISTCQADADEAPSEVRSTLEPNMVQSTVLSTDILTKTDKPKQSKESKLSKIEAITEPTESTKPAQNWLNEVEPTVVKKSQETETCKTVSRTSKLESTHLCKSESSKVHLIEPFEIQTKESEVSQEQSQVSAIMTQSMSSIPAESHLVKLEPAPIQLKKPDEPTDSQSKELKPIQSNSKVMEATADEREDKVSTEIPSKVLEQNEPTIVHPEDKLSIKVPSKDLEQIELTIFGPEKKISIETPSEILKEIEPTVVEPVNKVSIESLSKALEQIGQTVVVPENKVSTKSPSKVLEQTVVEPVYKVSTESISKKSEQIQPTLVEPVDKVSSESPSKVLVNIEVQSENEESKESQSKILERIEVKLDQSKGSEPLVDLLKTPKPSKIPEVESAEIPLKELKTKESQPRALKSEKTQSNMIKPSQSDSTILDLPESQAKALEHDEILKGPKVAKVLPTKLEKTETQSELFDQTPNQSELTQSQDLKLRIAQLGLTKEKLSKIKQTNVDSNIEPMEIDIDSKISKEKGELKTLKESGIVCPNKSLIDVELLTNKLDGVQKLPPIKLTLTKVIKADKKTNDIEAQSTSKHAIVTSHQDKEVSVSITDATPICDNFSQTDDDLCLEQKKVRPIKLNLSSSGHNSSLQSSPQKINVNEEKLDSPKQVPKLTIKLGNKQAEEIKSPIPKLTIKPIRPPVDQKAEDNFGTNQQILNVTKLNIKPVVKPQEEIDSSTDIDLNDPAKRKDKIPSITKLNIKPIAKPAEKINEIHRKSSSSDISESEYSENDETSTSDQASASDQGPSDTVPKVTIKLGKPGTESEGKFYTEKNIPKLTIKGLQQNDNDEKDAKLKLVISQSDEITMEKVPKLTIKTVTKSDCQPLSPKLTIKPVKPPENVNEIPKLKITTDAFGSSSEIKENMHVPKITIKAVTKTDLDVNTKPPKKSTLMCDNPEHIPIVTKLNIKPVLKPMESGESSEELVDKVPVVSKLNIKPIINPKDNEVDFSVEDVPKIIKLNIKPLKNPGENSSEGKDCDENIVDMVDKNIPVVTKLNIKPIIKPAEDETLKDSENQSSETGTSSDDNSDHIPVVTKLNIKPIIKPNEFEEVTKPMSNVQSIPVVTKLNIKPLMKPEDNILPSSPKRESLKSPGSSGIPTVSKINIKPIVKHEDTSGQKIYDENFEKSNKNPPLVMKINMKNVCDNVSDQKYNSYVDGTKSPRQPMSPKIKKSSLTPDRDSLKSITAASVEPRKIIDSSPDSPSLITTVAHSSSPTHLNCLPGNNDFTCSKDTKLLSIETKQVPDKISCNENALQINEVHEKKTDLVASPISPGLMKQKKSLLNCTLLKQLLSNTKDDSEKCQEMSISNSRSEKTNAPLTNCNAPTNVKTLVDEIRKHNSDIGLGRRSPISEMPNDLSHSSKSLKMRPIQDVRRDVGDSVTKPLEIVTDKTPNQSSGQDSPRIILKINKTDHGPSSKIITEECHKPTDSPPQNHIENTHEILQEKQSPKKQYVNSRKKLTGDEAVSLTIGKRLRSSRVVETPEKPAVVIRRSAGKRPSISETSPTSNNESELSVLDSKRLKLEQLLSVNKGLTITPVASNFTQNLQSKPRAEIKQGEKRNHSFLNNDNSKNGNSKLHNILSNLQAKQMQSLQLSEATILNKDPILIPDAESNPSTGSSDVVVEISRIENSHPDVQEMIINENSDFRDMPTPEEISQDPLEVDALKTTVEEVNEPVTITAVAVTPTPRKRGRPRKKPLLEGGQPVKPPTPPALPVSALEERPQRSLRLMRDRPVTPAKPRGGRGRGRGGRRAASPIAAPTHPSDDDSTETVIVIETIDEDEPHRRVSPVRSQTPEDPTSSRIKLPRMTEALDKSSACMTPLSSRRRSSSDMKLFSEPSVLIESPVKMEEYMKSPETKVTRGRGSRGGRGTPRGRTPRGRGRGRGGGKGATYMKETMGIYGRVCGPATTTVELFEEETCMMDDNATPSKPSHLLDEDSQSSVKSSTNESSNKMKKSKFADLFDSNKVWMASDVKEYTWPPDDVPNVDHQVMMIQEQVAMFLGVKSFKRRYSELKRRAVVGEEKDYCLRKSIVTEALCDLGITAVDASDVLDVMLSDYPHKYEEYRSYQRQKQLTESLEMTDVKLEDKAVKIEVKSEKTSDKPEPPKVDPEKTRQDMAAAAIASAAEWNAMANVWRRGACADLQSNTIHRRRPPPTAAPTHCRPPHGFYPHAVLPGQYQHTYTRYTPEQLRYFPLNTVIAAPPAPPSPVESSSDSEGSWDNSSSSSDDSHGPHHSAKRKKLTKVKRSSQQEKDKDDSRGPAAEEVVDLCRVCKLRLEANRKYTHERFVVCADCNAKLHPGCLDLSADTIRKCREYAWQCGECKRCCACGTAPLEHKMVYCELCDRGFHAHCTQSPQPPTGRWHCAECAVCKSCGAREPGGVAGVGGTGGVGGTSGVASGAPLAPAPAAEWHHQTRRGPGGHKVYSHSLCTPCARMR